MVIVVIGRGIDLSLVANMAISVACVSSSPIPEAPLLEAAGWGLGFAMLMSLATGILIAYAEDLHPSSRPWP